jgi:hypothetical protein
MPISSAMCAFDSAQVLAEWVAAVQDRAGRYLGVLGTDDIDLESIPGLMWVEKEDVDLLGEIGQIIGSARMKMALDQHGMHAMPPLNPANGAAGLTNCGGYASQILMVTAYMLENGAVWPSKCFPLRLPWLC